MSQCSPRYMALCANPAVVSRDGYAGPNANIYLPWYTAGGAERLYFFNGAIYDFPGSTVPQSTQATIGGITKCNTESPCGC